MLEHAKTDYNTLQHSRNERDHPRLVMQVEFLSKSRLPAPLGYQVGRWSPVVTRGVWHISGSPDHSLFGPFGKGVTAKGVTRRKSETKGVTK